MTVAKPSAHLAHTAGELAHLAAAYSSLDQADGLPKEISDGAFQEIEKLVQAALEKLRALWPQD
jgi:hypothetical protein